MFQDIAYLKNLEKFANFMSVDKENEHGSNVYATSVADTTTTTPIIVTSKASTENLGFGLGFRSWNFIEGAVKFTPEGPSTDCCLDTDCGSTLGDREWISRDIPNAKGSSYGKSATSSRYWFQYA